MNLILSWYTYDWVKYCAQEIYDNPTNYKLIIICKDNLRNIYRCNIPLCQNAIYEQRRQDTFNLCKFLGIRSASNLQCDPNNLDIYRLSMQLSLAIMIGGIDKVSYSDNNTLSRIVTSIKSGARYVKFDGVTVWKDKVFSTEIKKLMIGSGSKDEVEF